MAGGIRRAGSGAVYEVRCPRCEVSFPVETRKCVHCGGPTAKPARRHLEEVHLAPAADTSHRPSMPPEMGDISVRPDEARPIEPESDPLFRSGTSITQSISESIHGPGPNERELEYPDEPPSLVRGLLNSLGGLVWVILLIAFTLARQCNGE